MNFRGQGRRMRTHEPRTGSGCLVIVVVFLLLFLSAVSHATSPPEYGIYLPGTIERVVDGDTVVFRTIMGFKVKVRFTDASSPEKNAYGGKKATKWLEDEATGEEGVVHLQLPDRDTWIGNSWSLDRWLGRVWANKRRSRTLGEWQIREGNAKENEE